ncbi:CLIP domain-containing serine protease B9-like [Culex pipiens pallens]|uniref:CLIP domain-containing serine protease B9-like n=1 Tax=Culex pipiens pallens TaxID=42434 RepID=UPI0022AA6B50|nr:CLIP domain-containing serine protease B9-like [Culex pipiens pallens]
MPIWTSSMVGNARTRKFPGLVQVQLLSFAGQQPVRGHGGTLSGRKTEGTLFSVRLVDCDTTTKIECIEKDDEEICADLPVDVAL